jgi:hypothetical protein
MIKLELILIFAGVNLKSPVIISAKMKFLGSWGAILGPIYLHEDKNREFVINRKRIDSKLKIVEPVTGLSQFSLFDYRKVLEEASEIHLIESSFAAFAESIDLTQKLYAHRYARGHALYDFRHEFTYRSNWNVLI